MNQTQISTAELATQQADANTSLAPMMLLDDIMRSRQLRQAERGRDSRTAGYRPLCYVT